MGAVKLERQPHGGALARSGRKPGARNKPKPARERVQRAAAGKCARAVKVLASIMDDAEQPGPVRVAAAREILNRGVGRPALWADNLDETEGANAKQRIEDLFGLFATLDEVERERDALRAELDSLKGAE